MIVLFWQGSKYKTTQINVSLTLNFHILVQTEILLLFNNVWFVIFEDSIS